MRVNKIGISSGKERASMKLSNEEIYILSEGLLTLIHNCSEACKLVPDRKAQEEIYNTIYKYQELNSKLLDRMRTVKE